MIRTFKSIHSLVSTFTQSLDSAKFTWTGTVSLKVLTLRILPLIKKAILLVSTPISMA